MRRPRYSPIANPDPSLERSAAGEAYPVAAFVCAVGFFLRLLMSAPVLNMLGIDYGGEDGSPLLKIHPGSYLIILSFVILLLSRGNPFGQIIDIARRETAFFVFFLIYVAIMLFWAARGPSGIGLIPDAHLTAPICVIVFSYAPLPHLRRILTCFMSIAVFNSAAGIFESLTHFRIFPFDPDWEVLKQDYFRASALLGHPLTNASFTAYGIFLLLSLPIKPALKSVGFVVMLASLVAFGGRSALIFCVAGLAALGVITVFCHIRSRRMNMLQLLTGGAALFLVPALCAGLLYAALHSGMGERLLAYNSLDDSSASVRIDVLQVFDYMTVNDLVFGCDGDRIADIGIRLGLQGPTSDIENPWLLIFMSLGALMFVLWVTGFGFYIRRLVGGAPLAVQLAVLEYFLISSTSNSFGRRDPSFMLLPGIVICIKALYGRRPQPRSG